MIYLKDLGNIVDEKVYEFYFDSIEIQNNLFIRRIEKVDGYFIFYYDESDKLKIEYKMVGNMICPDAYTLEDVEVPFEIEETENAITSMENEGIYLQSTTNEADIVKQIILPIVPIKVAKNEKIEYSNKCDWSFSKEEDFVREDPRLKDFKKLLDEEGNNGCSTKKK